jgi:hypothetical protein
MSETYPYTCPYCGRDSTIDENDYDVSNNTLYKDNADGLGILVTELIVCPNPKCKKVSFSLDLYKKKKDERGNYVKSAKIKRWQLLPPSKAKVFPDYVPTQIKNDYEEACSIVELSPKASATLARRCIQGMIRDFWKIRKPDEYKGQWRLIEEIKAIKDMVDVDVWDAISVIRSVGNIGAHMEADVNLIIDIEQSEAEKLIGLIEMLVEEWYVNSYKRKNRLVDVKAIGEVKSTQKEELKTD